MIKVAQIINTHGLKGECKLYLVTDDPQHRFEKGRVLHLEDGRTLTVVRYREQKGFGYCYFEGIDSIEKAEQLKTKNLFIAQDDLPELEEGQYYYHELMNCTVYNEEKEEVTIFAVNRNTKENVAFDADLRGFVDYRILEYSVMEQEDMKAVNLLNKETVRPVSKTAYRFEDGKFETVLGKCSWNVIRFGK